MRRTNDEKREMVKMKLGAWKVCGAVMYAVREVFRMAVFDKGLPTNAKLTDTAIKIGNSIDRLRAMQEDDMARFCAKNGENWNTKIFYPSGTKLGKELEMEAFRFVTRVKKIAEAEYVKDCIGGE